MRVKPTSASAISRSQQNRSQGIGLRRSSQYHFQPQMAVYNTGKPPKIDRTISTCGEGGIHVSVLNAPSPEEMSSDTKKKNGLHKMAKAFRKNFSTGWKNKQTKATLPPDASSKFVIFFR